MPIKHYWNGTILTVESDSGTSSADLKGAKGDTGSRGVRGLTGATGGGATIEDNVISEETTWSSSRIMDNFAEHMSVSGNPVTCMPIPNYPLHIVTTIEPNTTGISEVNVTRCGKNIIQIDDVVVTGSNRWENDSRDIILPAGTYTIRAYATQSNTVTYIAMSVRLLSDGMTIINEKAINNKESDMAVTFTIPENEKGVRVYFYSNFTDESIDTNCGFYNIIIEKGNQYTGYEAYNGNTYTMYLPEPIYGGSIDWNTGIVTADYDINGLLDEPYIMEVEPVVINAIEDTNTLYTDADNIQVIGRVDTMYQLSQLNARIAALEAALINA